MVLLAVFLACAAPARADYDAGVRAYTSGDFERALSEFRESARRGHSGAEFMLGVQYFNGAGVDHDPVTAAIYFHLAAEKGLPAAQLAFGSIHIRGVGVWQNLVRAHYWLTLAVQSRDPELEAEAIALRNATARLMTSDELARAAELAAAWRPARTGLMRFDP